MQDGRPRIADASCPRAEPLDNRTHILDHCPMQRIGDILARGSRQLGQVMRIRSSWPEIAGEVLAAHTEPVMIRNRVLQVLCDSPAWAQQAGLLSRVIEERVREVTGFRGLKIEARFGMPGRILPRTRKARQVRRPDIDPADIARIRDPALARAVRALVEGKVSDG